MVECYVEHRNVAIPDEHLWVVLGDLVVYHFQYPGSAGAAPDTYDSVYFFVSKHIIYVLGPDFIVSCQEASSLMQALAFLNFEPKFNKGLD